MLTYNKKQLQLQYRSYSCWCGIPLFVGLLPYAGLFDPVGVIKWQCPDLSSRPKRRDLERLHKISPCATLSRNDKMRSGWPFVNSKILYTTQIISARLLRSRLYESTQDYAVCSHRWVCAWCHRAWRCRTLPRPRNRLPLRRVLKVRGWWVLCPSQINTSKLIRPVPTAILFVSSSMFQVSRFKLQD